MEKQQYPSLNVQPLAVEAAPDQLTNDELGPIRPLTKADQLRENAGAILGLLNKGEPIDLQSLDPRIYGQETGAYVRQAQRLRAGL